MECLLINPKLVFTFFCCCISRKVNSCFCCVASLSTSLSLPRTFLHCPLCRARSNLCRLCRRSRTFVHQIGRNVGWLVGCIAHTRNRHTRNWERTGRSGLHFTNTALSLSGMRVRGGAEFGGCAWDVAPRRNRKCPYLGFGGTLMSRGVDELSMLMKSAAVPKSNPNCIHPRRPAAPKQRQTRTIPSTSHILFVSIDNT